MTFSRYCISQCTLSLQPKPFCKTHKIINFPVNILSALFSNLHTLFIAYYKAKLPDTYSWNHFSHFSLRLHLLHRNSPSSFKVTKQHWCNDVRKLSVYLKKSLLSFLETKFLQSLSFSTRAYGSLWWSVTEFRVLLSEHGRDAVFWPSGLQ